MAFKFTPDFRVNNPSKGGGGVDPVLAFFQDGTAGFYRDYVANVGLFTDTAGTTLVTADGQLIARANDKSPSGNSGTQSTLGSRPAKQPGVARFDGSDDALVSSLLPSEEMSLGLKFNPVSAAALRIAIGGATSAGVRVYIGVDASNRLCAAVGNTSFSTIAGGSSIAGAMGVAFFVITAATYALYYNKSLLASGARGGTVGTSPIWSGAAAGSGPGTGFCACDIAKDFAINKALTATDVGIITDAWGTT